MNCCVWLHGHLPGVQGFQCENSHRKEELLLLATKLSFHMQSRLDAFLAVMDFAEESELLTEIWGS